MAQNQRRDTAPGLLRDATSNILPRIFLLAVHCRMSRSATPFPKGDRSVYGLHQLLGFHRLKLGCELTRELPDDHPFELIKRKLYVKNPESGRPTAALCGIELLGLIRGGLARSPLAIPGPDVCKAAAEMATETVAGLGGHP